MPLNIDFQQVLLHILNFVILFGALYFLLYGPVKKFMDNREQMYKDLENDTKQKLSDAEKTKAEYEKKLAEVDEEIEKTRKKSQADAALEAEAIRNNARADAERIIKKAHIEAQKEHNELVESARKDIASAASKMAEKIVKQSVEETYDQFISAAGKSDTDA